MRLLQRYILGELLRVFFFVLTVLTVLLVFVGVFREAHESGLGPLQILEILPFVVPSMLPFTIPATLLLTVCVVYGRVAGDLEITAAKAAGINVMSLLWPSFLMGLVLASCSFFLTDRVIPWAMTNIQNRITMAMEDIFLDVLRSQLVITDPDRGFSVTVTAVEGRKLIRPTFQYTPPRKSTAVTIQAQEATLDFDLENQQVNLHLVRGYIDVSGQRRAWFQEEHRPFPMPMSIQEPKPRHLSIDTITERSTMLQDRVDAAVADREIETAFALAIGNFRHLARPDYQQYEAQISFDQKDIRKLNTEKHSRYALSASCLFFSFLGGPFAILQGRRQFLTSFFMCFMPVLVVYYPLVLLTMNFSRTGLIDPTWGMWAANAVLGLSALIIIRRVLRH